MTGSVIKTSDQLRGRFLAGVALSIGLITATLQTSPARASSPEEAIAAEAQAETCPAGLSMLKHQAKLKDFAKRIAEHAHLKILAIGSSST